MANRTISNPKRGCGHLKKGKAYIRGVIGSPDGVLPSFVRLDPPVPYREMGTDEQFTRGFLEFDGATSQFALDDITDFIRLYPGDASDDTAVQNMVDKGLYPDVDQVPDFEGQRHMDRVRARGTEGEDHFGAVDAVRQNDLLMRAGKTHYPDPDDFIDEAVELGISKAIPLSKRQDPPVIQPGTTRCWIVHPDTDDGWAVIGYAYLQEVVFTEPEDGNVPQYVREHDAAGRLDVVDIEPPRASDDDTGLDDWTNGSTPDARDDDQKAGEAADVDADPRGDDGKTVVPSDKPGRDVEAIDLDLDDDVSIDDVQTRGDMAGRIQARFLAWRDWYSGRDGSTRWGDLKAIARTARRVDDPGSGATKQDIMRDLAMAGYDPRQDHADALLNGTEPDDLTDDDTDTDEP